MHTYQISVFHQTNVIFPFRVTDTKQSQLSHIIKSQIYNLKILNNLLKFLEVLTRYICIYKYIHIYKYICIFDIYSRSPIGPNEASALSSREHKVDTLELVFYAVPRFSQPLCICYVCVGECDGKCAARMYMCIDIYMYIFVYICICIYIYIYTYIYV